MDNPFFLESGAYKRDLNILQHYIDDQARHLEIMTQKPYATCVEYVKQQLRPGGRFEFKDPRVMYTERAANGDRSMQQGTLSQYLNQAVANERLIAPSLTTYLNPKQCKSLLVDFIDDNVKMRGVAKKAMFAAKMAGDETLEKIYDNEQANRKLSNNSISGAHLSAHQPLFNKTAHITLTSNCRSTSGFGNANNEKLLSGNRHYWAPMIVTNNIISIINHTDYEMLDRAMSEYGILAPSYEQTMHCIQYSTQLYWHDRREMAKIEALVEKLTPIQRAAFVYTGDFYHLAQFNDAFARTFITRLSTLVETEHPDPESALAKANGALVETACQIAEVYMRGKELKKIKGTKEYAIVAATVAHMEEVLKDYFLFIRAFFVTVNVPASLAWFPDSIRRAALTSDTDSTIFTVQDWIEWYFGELKVDPASNGVAATMVFLSSQTIIHILARMSANFGIEEKRLFQIEMKNEYKFDVFAPTQVAKHYFAMIGCQEGNLYGKYKEEIKGVHLKSSNAPREIIKTATELMLDIMNTVIQGGKISLNKILVMVADIERDVMASIEQGDSRFFRKGQIKLPDSYTKTEDESPYLQYKMWNEVFGPVYGEAPPPPYVSVKVATECDTPAKTKEWLDTMEDQAMANRMRMWMTRNNKRYVGTIQLPDQIVASKGIPAEILRIAGVRKIVRDTTSIFYLILETLGFFILDKKILRLVSDLH